MSSPDKNWDALKKELNSIDKRGPRTFTNNSRAPRRDARRDHKKQQQIIVASALEVEQEQKKQKIVASTTLAFEQKRKKQKIVASALAVEQEQKLNYVIGVVLSFSTLNREKMVDFFVYHFKQRKFSHIVKVLRTKFPDSCQPGGWFRLLFSDDFDVIEQFRSLKPRGNKHYPVIIPRRAVICQRRLPTRIQDERVMFFVTANRRYSSRGDIHMYKCRLGMLKLTRAQLNENADDNSNNGTSQSSATTSTTKSISENIGDQQQQSEQQQLDELPERLKLWVLPSGTGDIGATGYFKVKRIDAWIWVSNNPESDDSDASSVNGDTNNINVTTNQLDLSNSFSKWFDCAVDTLHKTNRLSDERRLSIENFVAELQNGFRTEMDNNSLQIELFGSVLSGFGSNNCDIDLCLIKTGITDKEDVNGVIQTEKRREWHNKLVQFLRRSERYTVISVADARTPIVKFEHHGEQGFHGDISVENGLALHNTELLRLYSCFDKRVQPLGFAVKRWANLYGINDASAGSISSYAYIVMLIHFLQRTQPPVLPFLQNDKKGQRVEGWNVSFTREPSAELIYAKNHRTIAQLFHDFLYYYGFKFDVHTDVVQIRTSEPYLKLLRKETLGCGDDQRFRLCVEDPFDLKHNLTSGVREDTLHFVIKCFRYAFRGMARFDTENFATLNGAAQKEEEGDGTTKAEPKMSFDQLMRLFKPRRVIHLTNNNPTAQNQQQQQ